MKLTKKKYYSLIISVFVLCVFLIFLIITVFINADKLSQNPLLYCADYIGEDTFCQCYNSENEYYSFTNDKVMYSNTPIFAIH